MNNQRLRAQFADTNNDQITALTPTLVPLAQSVRPNMRYQAEHYVVSEPVFKFFTPNISSVSGAQSW
jgi:hypothetical protein